MKKTILAVLTCLLFMTGCTFGDDFSDKYLYTTMYPIEYATNELYSDYAKVQSVYPNGATNKYEVTQKKKEIYANSEIFIYAGIANEAYLARDMININQDLKLIDATKGMDINAKLESTWLDPSNYLMLCSNIKSSLIEYNDNPYIKEAIENNYKKLNEKVSGLDVLFYNIGKNGNYNTLLVTNDVFNYLTKYNINVISLDTNNETLDKAYADAKKMITSNQIKYVYYLDGDELTDRQNKFISDNSLTKITIPNLFTLTDNERKDNKDYITLMNEIIDNYKKELYKK